MSQDLSNKLVISAALAGAVTVKRQNPAVPYTPEEFGEEARKCYEAGASIVHIHARDPEKGNPTADLEQIRATLKAIKEQAPKIIINLSSAISTVVSERDRIAPVQKFKPPLASLNTNSMNFSVGDFKTGKVIMGNKNVFVNDFRMVEKFAKEMKKAGTKPEMEVYDYGGLYNMLFLNKQEDLFVKPLHFQLVFGVLGGIPFSPSNLGNLLNLMPEGTTWSVCGVAKNQIMAGLTAAAWGGHIRVGLEDNIRMPNGELAKGSWEQVQWATKVTELAGREVATPDEARKIFHLKEGSVEL
ncbi:MAG: 3-keto-5-aminohexanoate cleavage protein [Candidatus Hermodarchaeota archaeon]